jgi:hypothetical protein
LGEPPHAQLAIELRRSDRCTTASPKSALACGIAVLIGFSQKSVCKQKNKPSFIVPTNGCLEPVPKSRDEKLFIYEELSYEDVCARIEHNVLELKEVRL